MVDKLIEVSEKKPRLWTGAYVTLLVIQFLCTLNGAGINNGITLLVEWEHGPVAFSGLIVALYSGSALVMRFFAGGASDRYGRRPIILAGAVFFFVGAMIPVIFSSIYWFIPSRILMGFGFSLVGTTATAAVPDIVPPSRVGEGAGLFGLSFSLSMAVGPYIALYLVHLGNGRVPMFGAFAAFAIVEFLLAWSFNSDKAQKSSTGDGSANDKVIGDARSAAHQSFEQAADTTSVQSSVPSGFIFRFIEKTAVRASLISFLYSAGQAIFMTYIILFAERYGLRFQSIYFVLASIMMIVVRLTTAKLLDKYPVSRILVPSLAVAAVGLFLPIFFRSSWVILVIGVCYGASGGLVGAATMAESIRHAAPNRRGVASATFYIFNDIAMFVFPLFWGVIIDHFGFSAAFAGGTAVVVLAIILTPVLIGNRMPNQADADAKEQV